MPLIFYIELRTNHCSYTGAHNLCGATTLWKRELKRSNTMKSLFARFAKDQSGATAIEYGLIASLIGVAIIGAVTTTGTKLKGTFNNITGNLL